MLVVCIIQVERNVGGNNAFAFFTRHARKNTAHAIDDLSLTEIVRLVSVALGWPGQSHKISCVRSVNYRHTKHSREPARVAFMISRFIFHAGLCGGTLSLAVHHPEPPTTIPTLPFSRVAVLDRMNSQYSATPTLPRGVGKTP